MMVAMATMLVSCDKFTKPSLSCSDEQGQATALSIIVEQIEKATADEAGKDEDGSPHLAASKIRAALKLVKLRIDDIRTSKEDPNSTKKFCIGKLKMVFPSEVIEEADKARELAGMSSISTLAENADMERDANSFSSDINFSVQPTDDGQKVYAEVENGGTIYKWGGEVLAAHLMLNAIETAKFEEQQAQETQNRQQEKALSEQRQANLAQAKAENELSMQTINTIWQAIDPESRGRLLDIQRAWIKKKSIDCKTESSSTSIEPVEIETSRLGCETRQNNERSSYLKRFLDNESY